MGMTIEEARTALGKERKYALHENKQAFDIAIDVMSKYQMMQADYNARLKADMVAMLTEIQLEIEELDSMAGYDGNGMPTFSTDYIRKKKVNELIQQKINVLKENTDET